MRRERIAVAFAAGVLAAAAGLEAGEPPRPRDNVLFVVADDLRPLIGAYGDRLAVTPSLDRLAARGALFRRAYVQQAWCSPSRTSVLTGLRPDRTGVYDLVTHFRDTVPAAITLPQHFRAHGYFTAAVGKVLHEGLDDEASWSVPGWQPAVPDPLKHYLLPSNAALARDRRGYAAPFERADVPDGAYPDGQVAERAIALLSERRDRPFFLAVGFYRPHLPFNAPARYWDLQAAAGMRASADAGPPSGAPPESLMRWSEHHNYAGVPRLPNGTPLPEPLSSSLVHGYRACVSYVDAQVGRLLDALESTGQAERTIVVFWGDHGFKLGEHGAWSKHTNYEVDTRVPLIVRVPGAPAGLELGDVVELVDLYPTLVELAGLPPRPGLQGESLAPLLRSSGSRRERPAFSEFVRNGERTHTTYAEASVLGQAVRTDRHRLVRWVARSDPRRALALELYDHSIDPGERRNLAEEPAQRAVVARLLGLLDRNLERPFARAGAD